LCSKPFGEPDNRECPNGQVCSNGPVTSVLPEPWGARLADLVGPLGPAVAIGPAVSRVCSGRGDLIVKVSAGALDEAAGLNRLGQVVDGPAVPEVVLAGDGVLVTAAVELVTPGPRHEESLGLGLAHLHRDPVEVWGGGSSWVGHCPVDPGTAPTGPSYYARRLRSLAARCGLEAAVEPVAGRLDELLPSGGPALVHGDLWWGNVLDGTGGKAWVIDPSIHGGHPEEDLAMLALFGPLPDRVRGAYAGVRALETGWEERVALFQLAPLLVHAILFGGGYGPRAEAVARRYA
jgi:fructosamine-3-kinase